MNIAKSIAYGVLACFVLATDTQLSGIYASSPDPNKTPEVYIGKNTPDFRMMPIVWTFDTISVITESEKTQNLGGIYYQGMPGASLYITPQKQDGSFSDGLVWSCGKVILFRPSTSSFDSNALEGDRRIAGKYINALTGCLAFNTSVPGTCYVIAQMLDQSDAGASTISVYSQEKGFQRKWTAKMAKSALSEQPSEIKLHQESAGSFWITVQGEAKILAVRFEPDVDNIIPLIKSKDLPQQICKLENGNFFADFGKDAFSQLDITLTSTTNTDTITLHLGECEKDDCVDKNPGGSRRYKALRIPLKQGKHIYHIEAPWDVYSNGLNALYMPMEIGEVIPFRYCEIEGYKDDLQAADLFRYTVNYRFDEDASYFHCDNEELNQVWELCKYSIKATSFIGYYVDGDRERRPYEADALINQLGHYGVDCDYSIGRRTIEYLLRNPTWPTEWIMQTVLMAWYDYLFSGDDRLIREYADQFYAHTLMGFVDSKNGFVTTTAIEQTEERLAAINRSTTIRDIVDWPHSDEDPTFAPQGGEDDGYVYTDYNTVVNAYHYEACKKMALIYEALGKSEEMNYMQDYCQAFKERFNENFFNKEKGIYKDGITTDHSSLHANMFALCFDLVPDEYKNSVSEFVLSRGMSCSVYGAQFLLDALYKAGYEDIAYQYMSRREQRSWMNMLEEGSTITTEAWSNEIKPNQDWNHAWGAAPADIIPFRLVGIRPTAPGFARAEIRPQIGELSNVDCKVPTLGGAIILSIQKTDSQFSMQVEIPPMVESDIYIPQPQSQSYVIYMDDQELENLVLENGFIKVANAVNGIHNICMKINTPTSVHALSNTKQRSTNYDLRGIQYRTSKNYVLRRGIVIVR